MWFLKFFLISLIYGIASLNAEPISHKNLMIQDVWSRATPAINGAVYLSIFNHGPKLDRIISVQTDIAKKAEIHVHSVENGIMKMKKISGVEISSGEPAVFKPGGTHIMLIGLKHSLHEGDRFLITLEFQNAGKVDVDVVVGRLGDVNHHHKKHKLEGHKHGS